MAQAIRKDGTPKGVAKVTISVGATEVVTQHHQIGGTVVPNGFDLFNKPWPPQEYQGEVKTHPLYQDFIKKAIAAGFAVDSGGFQDSERTYFMFYLMGTNATLV